MLEEQARFEHPEDTASTEEGAASYTAKTTSRLMRLDRDGICQQTVELDLPEDESVWYMALDLDGRIYVLCFVNGYVFQPDGSLLSSFQSQDASGLYQLSSTEIALKSTNSAYQVIDPNTGELGEAQTLGKKLWDTPRIFPGRDGFQYLYTTTTALYGSSPEAERPTKLISWLDCNIDGTYIEEVEFLPDGRVAVVERRFLQDNETNLILLMPVMPVAPSELEKQQLLTLGTYDVTPKLRQQVTDFNRRHTEVQVRIIDYAELDEGTDTIAGYDRLDMEIVTGNMPDMLASGYYLDLPFYGEKGLMLDLWPLLDADASIGREDLMTHVLDVLYEDGSLYEMPMGFYIQSAVVRTDVVGDRES